MGWLSWRDTMRCSRPWRCWPGRWDDPSSALFFPFAAFSPEWVALRYARKHEVPLHFIDLPASVALALETRTNEPPLLHIPDPQQQQTDERMRVLRADPLLALAEAAGYADSELFWGTHDRRAPRRRPAFRGDRGSDANVATRSLGNRNR